MARLRSFVYPLVLIFLLQAPVAAAAPLTVRELSASPQPGDGALRVPGRSPRGRYAEAGRAGASSVRVLDVSAEGTRTNGKVIAREGGYTCSGTAINTPSRSIVLTAGHCVIERGKRTHRFSFVPAYDHGARPFGVFKADVAYVMPQWARDENPDFDVAALRVKRNKLGRLVDVVGARGFATSKSRLGSFEIFGYPAARAKGEELRSCHAHGLGSDRRTARLPGPPTMPASCDMAAGASGGAWLFNGEYVSGVTSYGYQGDPTQLFSPYFGPAVGSFLRKLP